MDKKREKNTAETGSVRAVECGDGDNRKRSDNQRKTSKAGLRKREVAEMHSVTAFSERENLILLPEIARK